MKGSEKFADVNAVAKTIAARRRQKGHHLCPGQMGDHHVCADPHSGVDLQENEHVDPALASMAGYPSIMPTPSSLATGGMSLGSKRQVTGDGERQGLSQQVAVSLFTLQS